ncbi:hypothetical protein HDU82_006479 [Entophlyctis luteolus]|nr:hypothetical protein HDU82_006479 [Entophlyctis luteolus]
MRTVGGGSEARNVMGLRAKTIEELQMENEQLKQTVDYLSKKVQALEKAGEENNLLKSSIMQFQQDVQRQAKRYGVPGSHAVTAGSIQQQRKQNSSTNISQSQSQSPATIPGSDISLAEARAAINRVSMLEAELSAVNQSHAKQIEELTKYKDRWFKVKETARKKKDIKVAAATDVSADEVAIGEKGSTGAGAGGGGGDRSLDVSITSSISSAYVNNHRTTPTLAAEESGGGAAGSPVRRPLSSLSTATRMPNANYGISNMSESEQPSRTAPSIPVVYQHEYEQSATGVSLLPPAGEFSGAFSSQLNTPVASTLGLFRVDTAPAATPSASIVMDTSAALLSAQLRDPRANSDSSQRSIQPHSADMSNLEDEAKQQGRIAVKSHPPSETSESVTSSGMFYSAFS